jgi:hypothetical protein
MRRTAKAASSPTVLRHRSAKSWGPAREQRVFASIPDPNTVCACWARAPARLNSRTAPRRRADASGRYRRWIVARGERRRRNQPAPQQAQGETPGMSQACLCFARTSASEYLLPSQVIRRMEVPTNLSANRPGKRRSAIYSPLPDNWQIIPDPSGMQGKNRRFLELRFLSRIMPVLSRTCGAPRRR